jgi:c-di-GMP-binding flagellar brake protein YcgR
MQSYQLNMMNKLNKNSRTSFHPKMGVLAVERRKHPRFSVELPLDYSRVDGKEIYGGIVVNASEGGILVYLPERMEIGTVLKIEILYVQGLELATVQAIAKVVWADMATRESLGEYRYGLVFHHIYENDYKRLVALLKEIGNTQ